MLAVALPWLALGVAPSITNEPDEICQRFKAWFPSTFAEEVVDRDISRACDVAFRKPSPEIEKELDRLAGMTEVEQVKNDAHNCKAMSQANRDPKGAKFVYTLGLRLENWERTQIQSYTTRIARASSNAESLSWRLGLYCSVKNPDQISSLVDGLASNLFTSEAASLIAWTERNRLQLPTTLTVSAQRRAELAELLETCPENRVDLLLPAFDRFAAGAKLVRQSPQLAAAEFVAAFCESGDRRHLENAAYSMALAGCDAGMDCVPRDLWTFPDGGPDPDFDNYVSRGSSLTALQSPVSYQNYAIIKSNWISGNLTAVAAALKAYEDSIILNGRTTDSSSAYYRYLVSLIDDPGIIPKQYFERLFAANLATSERASRTSCATAQANPGRAASCKAPHAELGSECTGRRKLVHGVCCFDGMKPNGEGVCTGSCPRDLVDAGFGYCKCPRPKIETKFTDFHCCWPGQTWNNDRGECEGPKGCNEEEYINVGDECWLLDPLMRSKKKECLDERGSNWASACNQVAHFYHEQKPTLSKEGYAYLADLYMRACKGGAREACGGGARLAYMSKSTKELVADPQARIFYRSLHVSKSPNDYSGTFGYSLFLNGPDDSISERNRMLEKPCRSPGAYSSSGAVQACDQLKTPLRDGGYTLDSRVQELICLNGLDADAKPKQEVAELIRRHCERLIETVDGGTPAREGYLRAALQALPNDRGWNGRRNRNLRNILAGQAVDSKYVCGRKGATPTKLSEEEWEMFRCYPIKKHSAEMVARCLSYQDYGSLGQECDGKPGAPDEQLCCPIEPPNLMALPVFPKPDAGAPNDAAAKATKKPSK